MLETGGGRLEAGGRPPLTNSKSDFLGKRGQGSRTWRGGLLRRVRTPASPYFCLVAPRSASSGPPWDPDQVNKGRRYWWMRQGHCRSECGGEKCSRCAEVHAHLFIESVSAEEEQKCAQQGA